MRFICKAAIFVAIVSMTTVGSNEASAQGASAQGVSASSGHRVAVVDVAFIFKNHAAIKAQVEAVERDLKNYDAQLQVKREELKQAAEKLKSYKVGSPEYTALEEQVATMESKLRLNMAHKRKELADAEARIYYENYQRISAAVKRLAEYHKINLVLRYNSEEMDLEKGESVIRGVMKNIVFHDAGIDMTVGVMKLLDQQAAEENIATGGPTTAPATQSR
ncbi:OmpH family outer membrane protein [Novipirellula artificiosorum]|uniref:Periplasmic chaperone n=1 Tax=Novipirellula artificiosorum TaxID=2528016 RepID=A0A5C6DJH4_9BACT|nr:OmpH family outer membrane protein [Novipirellula artificiosorum]TWU36057.1 periplasmic chaperone [Novipirellula artificiosorum]